jgi:hypothetical protein
MIERRNKGQRRWDLEVEYPLKDSGGFTVIADRRQQSDRRLDNISVEDRMIGFSEMPPFDPVQKKRH